MHPHRKRAGVDEKKSGINCSLHFVLDRDLVWGAFDHCSGKGDPEEHPGHRHHQKIESFFEICSFPHERSSNLRLNVEIFSKELEQP